MVISHTNCASRRVPAVSRTPVSRSASAKDASMCSWKSQSCTSLRSSPPCPRRSSPTRCNHATWPAQKPAHLSAGRPSTRPRKERRSGRRRGEGIHDANVHTTTYNGPAPQYAHHCPLRQAPAGRPSPRSPTCSNTAADVGRVVRQLPDSPARRSEVVCTEPISQRRGERPHAGQRIGEAVAAESRAAVQ